MAEITATRIVGTLSLALGLSLVPVARADPAADMAQKRAAEVGLQPGQFLDQSTAAQAKGLLPPEILKHYETGEYRTRSSPTRRTAALMAPTSTPRPSETPRSSTSTTTARSSTRPRRSSPRTSTVRLFQSRSERCARRREGALELLLQLLLEREQPQRDRPRVGESERGRAQGGPGRVLQVLRRPAARPEARRKSSEPAFPIHRRDLGSVDLYGTAALDWRFRDPSQRDSVWAYVPALRRIRGLSPPTAPTAFSART